MKSSPRLGARIRSLRRNEGLTQAQLAQRLSISTSYVNLLEHNRRPVTAQLLIKLAQVFDLELAAFSADDDERLDVARNLGRPVAGFGRLDQVGQKECHAGAPCMGALAAVVAGWAAARCCWTC